MGKYTVSVVIKQVYEVEAESASDARYQVTKHIVDEGFQTQNVVAQRWGAVGVEKGEWDEDRIVSFENAEAV
jgi:hypothetical protein